MSSLLLLTCCFLAQTEEIVSKDLHERCLVELRGVLDKGEEFVKVHAAESLLWTGYPEGVREAFLSEPQLSQNIASAFEGIGTSGCRQTGTRRI